MESLSFTLVTATIPVDINGKEYELRELTGKDANTFTNAQMSAIRFDSDGQRRLEKVGNLTSLLVHLSLWDVETNSRVPQSIIESWSSKIVDKLFDAAKKLSGLDQAKVQLSKLLKEALSADDSPMSYDDLVKHVNDIHDPEDRYKPLKVFLEEESTTKNS